MNTPEQLEGWQARRLAIAEHYRASGSLRATGREFGITAERVRQIVNKVEGTDASLPADRKVLG